MQLEDDTTYTLSINATANDLRDAVRILKKRPEGVSLAEATDPFKKRILNPRKVTSYEYWGIVVHHGDRLSLSPLGWEMARRTEPEMSVFRAILESIPLYRSALEWIHTYNLEHVAHPEVIAYWAELEGLTSRSVRENAIKSNAISFFHLCQGAEIGTVILGKRGQPARLLVDRVELEQHLTHAHSSLIAAMAEEENGMKILPLYDSGSRINSSHAESLSRATRPTVLISCAGRSPVTDQVEAALDLAGIKSGLIARGGNGNPLLTREAYLAFESSGAAIIVLTADDCKRNETGELHLDEASLIAIGAACALCNNRVLLLRENEIMIPSGLVEMKQCEFQCTGLSWDSGVKLVLSIKEMLSVE